MDGLVDTDHDEYGASACEPERADDRRMKRGAFAGVPLAGLFPGLSAAGAEALKDAARAVDAVRSDGIGAEWEWAPEHAVFPGPQPGTPIILGLDVVEHAGGGDQLEFLLQVVWTDLGRLAVDAAVNVACWCDADHASHDVDGFSRAVADPALLPRAFREGAERLTGWLADPRDADYWRAKAGLPARRPRREAGGKTMAES
ncbi:hypothetical protein [Streptomyces sp. NPDC005435]|uniref:hypothetical protein n=1 Tax=Streptomyces sp. NPDC005435 TaxID=3154464 RepID=UPI003453760A